MLQHLPRRIGAGLMAALSLVVRADLARAEARPRPAKPAPRRPSLPSLRSLGIEPGTAARFYPNGRGAPAMTGRLAQAMDRYAPEANAHGPRCAKTYRGARRNAARAAIASPCRAG